MTTASTTTSGHWADRAECRSAPGGIFFPTRRRGRDNHGREAKRYCAACPVVIDCLVHSIVTNEEHGIRGGAGESIRRGLARLYRARLDSLTAAAAWTEAVEAHLACLRSGRPLLIDRNGPGATHGLAATYNRGCRCGACVAGRALDDFTRARARREAAA